MLKRRAIAFAAAVACTCTAANGCGQPGGSLSAQGPTVSGSQELTFAVEVRQTTTKLHPVPGEDRLVHDSDIFKQKVVREVTGDGADFAEHFSSTSSDATTSRRYRRDGDRVLLLGENAYGGFCTYDPPVVVFAPVDAPPVRSTCSATPGHRSDLTTDVEVLGTGVEVLDGREVRTTRLRRTMSVVTVANEMETRRVMNTDAVYVPAAALELESTSHESIQSAAYTNERTVRRSLRR